MKTISWITSMTVHGIVLLCGGLAMEQAVVGIAPGRNSIQVNLVAAPSEPATESAVTPPVETPVPPAIQPTPRFSEMTPSPSVEPMSVPAVTPPPLPATVSQVTAAHTSPNKPSRDHSRRASSNAGRDAVTAQSVAGAIVDEEPDYLSNPAPIYPQEARDQNEEGLVVLDVIVSPEGRPETIRIAATSAYYLLDAAARDAVRQYRFRPATLNGIKVRAHVKVPIRFRLNN